MKATLFARPNLKLFMVGAILVVVIQHLISDGFSQGADLDLALAAAADEAPAPGLDIIVAQARHMPVSHLYAQLSGFYEERGDLRKALRYLRLAHLAAESEEEMH